MSIKVNEELREIYKIFQELLKDFKFNYPTYEKHLKMLFIDFVKKEQKKIEKETYSYQNHSGEKFEVEYEGFDLEDELEEEVEDLVEKLRPDIELFKVNHNIYKGKASVLLSTKTFEEFSDKINEIYTLHQGEKLLKSILSKKYKDKFNITNPELIKLYSQISQLKVDHKMLQDFMGKKLATIKDSNEFFERSKKMLRIFSSTFNSVLSTIEDNQLNVDIVEEDYENDLLIVKINDYKASRMLGSQSWCISYNQGYFNDYISVIDKEIIEGINNVQLFIWDFSLPSNDDHSMIGVTLTRDGNIKAAHLKDDSACDHNYLRSKFKKALEKNYWDVSDEILVPAINNSDLKRNKKLDLLIEYAKDDVHIYNTFEYLEEKFDLSQAQYLWLQKYKSFWDKRVKNACGSRKAKYFKKLKDYFENHEYYESEFKELYFENQKNKISNF